VPPAPSPSSAAPDTESRSAESGHGADGFELADAGVAEALAAAPSDGGAAPVALARAAPPAAPPLEHAPPKAEPPADSHSVLHLGTRSKLVIKTVLGLLLLFALAFLGGHPRVRALERAVGVSRVMAAGLPFVLLGLFMRHPAVRVLSDSVLDDLDPVLRLGLGWIGFVIGFRMDTRVFVEISSGVKQLVLGRAIAACVVIIGSALLLLHLSSGAVRLRLADPIMLRDALVLASAGVLTSLSTPHLLAMLGSDPKSVGIVAQVVRIQEVLGIVGMLFLSAYFRPHGSAVSWQIPGAAWLFITLGLGVTIGLLVYTILLRLSTNTAESAVLILGSVSFASGVAAGLLLSPVTVCFVGGMVLANFPGPYKDRVRETLERLERPIYLLFLIVVGALWRVDDKSGWILMGVFVIARIIGFGIGTKVAFDARQLPLDALGGRALVISPMGSLPIASVISAKLLYSGGAISELVTAVVGGAFASEVLVQIATRIFLPTTPIPISPAAAMTQSTDEYTRLPPASQSQEKQP